MLGSEESVTHSHRFHHILSVYCFCDSDGHPWKAVVKPELMLKGQDHHKSYKTSVLTRMFPMGGRLLLLNSKKKSSI